MKVLSGAYLPNEGDILPTDSDDIANPEDSRFGIEMVYQDFAP